MIEEKLINKIKEKTTSLLSKMGILGKIKVKKEKEMVFVEIEVSEGETGLLIGRGGEGLEAFQHILRSLLLAEGHFIPLILNIGNFREKEKERLQRLAEAAALKVKLTGKPEVLLPMSAYQRRIVHLALAKIEEISEESLGEKPNRRIIIKPK